MSVSLSLSIRMEWVCGRVWLWQAPPTSCHLGGGPSCCLAGNKASLLMLMLSGNELYCVVVCACDTCRLMNLIAQQYICHVASHTLKRTNDNKWQQMTTHTERDTDYKLAILMYVQLVDKTPMYVQTTSPIKVDTVLITLPIIILFPSYKWNSHRYNGASETSEGWWLMG